MCNRHVGRVAALAGAGLLHAGAAGADTLADVVRAVGGASPRVVQAQAQAEAAVAGVGIARAAARPQLTASVNALHGTKGANAQAGFDQTLDSNLGVQFPIYSGGRIGNGIRGARARADQARFSLDQTRADAVGEAISAYLDVLRDRAAVALVVRNAGLLERVLQGTQRQFEAGDSTRTDIAQARARLSLGRARLEAARAAVLASETRYRQLVGFAPGELAPPPPLPAPAADPETVARTALARSPAVAAADAGLRAARADTAAARAGGRPQLTTTLSGQFHDYRESFAGYVNQRGGGAQASVSLSVPVYSGGLAGAEVARARAGEAEASGTRELAGRRAAADARRALIDYRAQVAMTAVDEERVAASREALTGVEADHRDGERTVLDVLNATVELLDAETSLLQSRHDAYVAGVAALRSIDRLGCMGEPVAEACAAAMSGE